MDKESWAPEAAPRPHTHSIVDPSRRCARQLISAGLTMDRLPTEIRLMIWRFAVDMVYEPRPPCAWSLAYRAPYLSIHLNRLDEFPLPKSTLGVFQVNRESRHEAVSRCLLFKARNGSRRGRVRADIDVFIFDVGVLVEMACAPEWRPPHSGDGCAAVAWPPPLAAIYTSAWHNLAFVRKILLPSVCFTYLFRNDLAPLLALPYLRTVYVDFGHPLRSAAREYSMKMSLARDDRPGLWEARHDEFHAWYQEHVELEIGPELKHSDGTQEMSEATKVLFRKWKRIFLEDVLVGWKPFAGKGVVGILVSDLHYGLQTEIQSGAQTR
ncbi:hypothetical protein GGS23DRAFT_596375 [Durotheca rogersii]|uniref:uncharacterized protein n=1 Tax=Durotheca rogersii TaxID=419775 RepID=UPI0022201116|nr:uncharacterized protein GGS23DRAFT_596375 [Durotheca rogersii]KAI5863881.1 hypothetical protein GGS23DRAFT_596375 [Durotheca rogersii]